MYEESIVLGNQSFEADKSRNLQQVFFINETIKTLP